MSEKITPVQKTILRRINRRFELIENGVRVEAVLTLPVETFTVEQMIHKTYNRHLIVELTKDGFRAEIFQRGAFKKTYWKKWRFARIDETVLMDRNFHNLIKQVKAVLEGSNGN